MNNEKIKELQAYNVEMHKFVEELNSDAWLLRHKKTKARILLLSNSDDNKVFNIAFRTPVSNHTGVPHIIEHSVLCGSEKYPIKDPFMELVKGSLNTFLNAMTYPDKTMYPVASCNDQDFKNLMSVYMDAVFKPNIYKEENIFKQEGWHYELENKDADLEINGIVYNEMKGVYSAPESIADRSALRSLYPDTAYSKDSGGDPDFIPELTYEDYLEFHRTYYHPSNSYIYMYGDMDMLERLQWLDEQYLNNYEYLAVDSELKMQPAFNETRKVEIPFAIAETEEEKESGMLSLNYVVGTTLDAKLSIAFEMLDYAIMEMPGAPLKQAIMDAGIGKDVYSMYEKDVLQPCYGITAKYADIKDQDRLVEVIESTLKDIVKKGVDKKVLTARLANIEFRTREADFGRYPRGLIWGITAMSSWLYDDEKPLINLELNDIYKELREEIQTDYFEQLIEKYLLNNTHSSMVVLVPKKGLNEKNQQKLKDRLAEKKAAMTDEEIEQLVKATADLKAYQQAESSKEDLETIPLLEIKDISKEPRPIIRQEENLDGAVALFSDIFTNGIAYVAVAFDCSNISSKYHNYLGLLKYVLSYMDTTKSYMDLNTEIDMNLGGFAFDATVSKNSKTSDVIINLEIYTKMLYENMDKAFEYMKDIILNTKFDDYKRLKEILEEVKSRLANRITQSGDSTGMLKVMSYIDKSNYLKEQITGYSFYKFVEGLLKDFDNVKEDIAKNLSEVMKEIFTEDKMLLNFAGNKENYEKAKEMFKGLRENMYPAYENNENWQFVPEKKNEGIKTSGQVQYVARGGKYDCGEQNKDFSGSMLVLANIMRSEYLWNNIRVLGGAYGCNCVVNRNGDVILLSYRDPNLEKTNEVYLNAADYLANFNVDERDMRKFIIGTISGMDTPLNPSDISGREMSLYLTGVDYDTLKKERMDVLNTTAEDIRKLAENVRTAMNQNNICVIGTTTAIEANKELFMETKEL